MRGEFPPFELFLKNTTMTESCEFLKESVESILGILTGQSKVALRGDPTMRETAPFRPKEENFLDTNLPQLQEIWLHLLLKTDVYNIDICCNNSIISTRRVFFPFIDIKHNSKDLITPEYMEQNFSLLSFREKEKAIKKTQNFLSSSFLNEFTNDERLITLSQDVTKTWEPMNMMEISGIIAAIPILRNIDHYYLRKISICLVQKTIELQFNCDGTFILASAFFNDFIKENI
jgi:hypothetical protein